MQGCRGTGLQGCRACLTHARPCYRNQNAVANRQVLSRIQERKNKTLAVPAVRCRRWTEPTGSWEEEKAAEV